VLLVDMERLHECEPTAGTKNPTDPKPKQIRGKEYKGGATVRN